MNRIKGAVLYEYNQPVVVEDMELGSPQNGEVLVKMMASGVCHSDWHVVKGEWSNIPTPVILGHEGAGIIEEIGPGVTTLQPGDHVILSWMPSCGLCEACQIGRPNVCYNPPASTRTARTTSTNKDISFLSGLGTMSSHAIVTEEAAVSIDKTMPFPQASLVGCGVMTGVGAAINTAKVHPGSSVAVFGAGGVGLNVIQGAAIAGATTIISVDLLDNKLELAKQFGATHTVNSKDSDPVEAIKDLTGGLGVHYGFEAIGLVPEPFVQTIHAVRNRGLAVWVGHAPLETPVTIDARDIMWEKKIIGSMYGSGRPHIDFGRLISLYQSGQLKLDELITRSFNIDDVNTAFKVLGEGKVARSVLTFD
ncbi:MAG: Zn-dependent alcohol dehydrogenase [Chloroflexota bacterium]|jgi:S-(hydroxymethyl)glutathione dehydrogenase/alcohol dehydrogenase